MTTLQRLSAVVFFLLLAMAGPLAAQSWDTSGNGQLNGAYYFREASYLLDQYGNIGGAAVVYGNLYFDGNGGYSVRGSIYDGTANSAKSYTLNGTYSISASGFGILSSPDPEATDATGAAPAPIYVLVTNGTVVGSSTESGFNDLFAAVPVGSTPATNATFNGPYTIAYLNFLGGSPADAYDAFATLTPNGAGTMGTVGINGYIENSTSAFSQTETGVKYSFSNGACVLTFPNSSNNAITGQEYLYISPDGNFVFGGSPVGFDFFMGTRTGSTAPNLSGMYYQAGINVDESNFGYGYAGLSTFYGSFSANGGSIINHQRYVQNSGNALDYTSSDTYNVSSSGNYTDANTSTAYVLGNGGAIEIGLGIGPYLGISVALRAPTFSGSGVYLSPVGVENAASSAPFTAGISRGELLTLYGTNLASALQVAPTVPLPAKLGGVQVLINGVAAPIYYVSPTQVSAIVPYGTQSAIATIQVVNNGTSSNTVTAFVNLTSPGVFTQNQSGLGYAAALHQNGTLVTAANPAQAGEVISVFLTGLGDVSPGISDGAAGPTGTLSAATNTITAKIGGVTATVGYAGLAPQLAALYQVNVTVPSGVSTGDNALDIAGPDFYTSQALLPVGTGSGTSATPSTAARYPAILRQQRRDSAGRTARFGGQRR